MSEVIPEAIWLRIKEFAALRKTGQIALNFFDGQILTVDMREHFKARPQKSLDKSGDIRTVAQ